MSIGYLYTVARCVADKWKWETAHLTPGAGIETFEESNINKINFQFGHSYITLDYLRVYVAVTTQQAKIKPNYKGFMEHEHFSWLTFEVMMEKAYDYLKPAIEWAREEALNENTD